MKSEIVKITKYGREVYANKRMDEARREECLCMNCAALAECPIAKEGLRLCQLTDIAFMVTRCPKFSARAPKLVVVDDSGDWAAAV